MIFIVNGAPGSGKTTFEHDVQDIMGNLYCHILSSIDFVKKIAKTCGWNGEKTPKNRKFLSDLKDLLTEWNDVPFKQIEKEVTLINNNYHSYSIDEDRYCIFIDVREPKEIKKCCEQLGAMSILIHRAQGAETEISNHADQNVADYNYDIIIENNATLIDLKIQAHQFVDKFFKKKSL